MKNDKTMPNVSNFERFNTFLWVLTISTILHDCPSVNGFGGGGPSGGSGEKKQLDKECLVHNSNQNEPLEYCAYANYGRTASYCLKVCASEGADYGGPVTSLLCCCGSSLSDSPSNKGCDDKCSGDDTEACGHQESAIISTIDENQPKLEYDGDLKYIGCFSSENIEQEQASEQPSTLYRNLYPSFCIAYCKDASDSKSGIMYAGLGIMKLPVTTLYKCLCLEKKQVTKEGLCNLLPEESCSEKCPGNDEKCGSENAVNLYKFKDIEEALPICE